MSKKKETVLQLAELYSEKDMLLSRLKELEAEIQRKEKSVFEVLSEENGK